MTKWIKFIPSVELPKERVSIAYDTHDERGVRYAYGYFQFHNGTCSSFWKDGNEQPKVVKAEDIKYWMPVPSLDVQEESTTQVWHDAIEEPEIHRKFLARFADGKINGSWERHDDGILPWKDVVREHKITHWCYIDDLNKTIKL